MPYYFLFGAGFLVFKGKKKEQKFLSVSQGRILFFKSRIIRFRAHGDMKLLPGAINWTNGISLYFLIS